MPAPPAVARDMTINEWLHKRHLSRSTIEGADTAEAVSEARENALRLAHPDPEPPIGWRSGRGRKPRVDRAGSGE